MGQPKSYPKTIESGDRPKKDAEIIPEKTESIIKRPLKGRSLIYFFSLSRFSFPFLFPFLLCGLYNVFSKKTVFSFFELLFFYMNFII